MVNGRRVKGQDIIPIQDFDPQATIMALMQESQQAEQNKKSKQEMSDEYKEELRSKMDKQHYVEYHKKQSK